MRSTARPPTTLLALALLTGCAQAETEVPPVAAARLEQEISTQVEQEVGVAADVSCPADLPSEVGASVTCTIATSDEVTQPLVAVATVTAVDRDTGEVEFDIVVDVADAATPGPAVTDEPPTSPPPTEESAGG